MDFNSFFASYFESSAVVAIFTILAEILMAVLILVVGFALIKLIINVLDKMKGLQKLEKNALSFINSFVSIVLKIIVVITALSTLGVPTTAIVTLLGTVGLALGLALQGSLSNFAGGMMLLIFKPFRAGDFITCAQGSGSVESVGIFYTIIRTDENKIISIPNGALSNSAITNSSVQNEYRYEVDVTVDGEVGVNTATELLVRAAKNSNVSEKNVPGVAIKAAVPGSTTYTLSVWADKAVKEEELRSELLISIRDILKENNINFS